MNKYHEYLFGKQNGDLLELNKTAFSNIGSFYLRSHPSTQNLTQRVISKNIKNILLLNSSLVKKTDFYEIFLYLLITTKDNQIYCGWAYYSRIHKNYIKDNE